MHSFNNRAAIIVAAFEVQASGEITHIWCSQLNCPVYNRIRVDYANGKKRDDRIKQHSKHCICLKHRACAVE